MGEIGGSLLIAALPGFLFEKEGLEELFVGQKRRKTRTRFSFFQVAMSQELKRWKKVEKSVGRGREYPTGVRYRYGIPVLSVPCLLVHHGGIEKSINSGVVV